MNRAFEKDIRFNLAKLKFKLKEVKFMGDIISADGRKPDPDKVRAIVELRQPHDKAALLHFMMNYLSPFCPNLSATLKPPRSLTHDGVPYLWSSTQEEAFMKAIWATRSLKTSWPRLQLLWSRKASGVTGWCIIPWAWWRSATTRRLWFLVPSVLHLQQHVIHRSKLCTYRKGMFGYLSSFPQMGHVAVWQS